MMNFTSVMRFVHNSSSIFNNVLLTRNISTVVTCRKSASSGDHCLQALSIFRFHAVNDVDTKRRYSKFTSALPKEHATKETAMVQLKKRPIRKKRLISEDQDSSQPGFWNVKAFATAEDYNLESLVEGLLKQDLYIPKKINASSKCE